MSAETHGNGRVFIVGAGPGDPELLTLRAARLLEGADAVVYDRLVSEQVLSLCPPRCRRIYAGKSAGRHTLTQEEINRLLVEFAREGLRVVRLKGGDPFVFGRGGEEALALAESGIPFEIIPGVSSAVAGPAYAGIPVTHRGLAAAVTFVTAHEDPAKPDSQVDYAHLAQTRGTLVFLMGARSVGRIAHALITGGMAPATPVAIVENATTERQRTIRCSLESAPLFAEREEISPPAVIVVGEVAALSDELDWFHPEARREILWGHPASPESLEEQLNSAAPNAARI
ncbi:MAG: uroporphyrinogen-III C-methyltransferase [bacterium]|nr:uroporphyrinogen-III C-methyltransferase [bacterium]